MFKNVERNAKGQITYFNNPQQVCFLEEEVPGIVNTCYGIAYGDTVVCACCGVTFALEEIYDNAPKDIPAEDVLKPYEVWVDFSDCIKD